MPDVNPGVKVNFVSWFFPGLLFGAIVACANGGEKVSDFSQNWHVNQEAAKKEEEAKNE